MQLSSAAGSTPDLVTDGPMPTIPVEIMIDVPAGVTVGEYERIDNGHSFHVSWEFPSVCVCETCKREKPLNLVDKDKFLVIRDLDIWGQPSFFVYQERLHRCLHCGHRQAMIPPFKRRDVKYTYRFEELVLVNLIKSTAQDVAQQLGISAETVERIVKNRIEDAKAMKVDPQRVIKNIGLDELSLRKGHKAYATILTDLTDPSKPEVLALAKGRDEDAARQCLEVLSPEQRAAVATHSTDMGPAYLSACRTLLASSQSVIDRFHVAKKLGEVADTLRKKTTEPTSEACPARSASVCVP
jgi:transposase